MGFPVDLPLKVAFARGKTAPLARLDADEAVVSGLLRSQCRGEGKGSTRKDKKPHVHPARMRGS